MKLRSCYSNQSRQGGGKAWWGEEGERGERRGRGGSLGHVTSSEQREGEGEGGG